MKQVMKSLLAVLAVVTVSGCAGHAERAKMGVAWVEAERAQALELARQGFSWGGRE